MNASVLTDELFSSLQSLDLSHPPRPEIKFPGFVNARKQIAGLGFFPGGQGLWKEPGSSLPVDTGEKPILVLGNNFGTASYLDDLNFEESRSHGTWMGLIALFKSAGVPLHRCFFTNAYPALLLGVKNVSRICPKKLDPSFIERCQVFLHSQIHAMQPRLILTLGKASPYSLGDATLRSIGWEAFLNGHTGELGKFAELDAAGKSFIHGIRTEGLLMQFSLAALLHPSNRLRNLKHRALLKRGKEGDGLADPEAAMLRSAVQALGLGE